jgi:DNA-binding SARP family transcriptional activator/tetratricopeptide (TPR) repeat protein
MPGAMEFGLLGPLVVRSGEAELLVRRGHQRALLAVLLLEANRPVPVEAITRALWGPVPPRSAPVAIRSYIRWLRLALGQAGRERISTQPRGYLIRVADGELDLVRFERLLESARAAARSGSWLQAAAQAREALACWRGEPLADIESDVLALREVPRLAELRLQAVETRIDADLRLGGHAEVTAELQRLCAAHPLREHMHALLMLALYRCGRQAEALAAYQQVRSMLVEELGADPGAELQTLHRQILSADPALAARQPGAGAMPGPSPSSAGRTNPGAAGGMTPMVPRQLPATVAHFVGRGGELQELTRLLDRVGEEMPGTVVISAIGGTAGVGKTALAVHWAHQNADRFPGGQLYIDLRGFDPSGNPLDGATAVRRFLDALGVSPARIPTDVDAQIDLYRSQLADKRLLVVLDNARDAEQVRPLLPGALGCAVLVTSRNQLAGLVAVEGARPLILDLLTSDESRELLARRLGPERLAAEQPAVDELIDLCACLPLALNIAAAHAALRPQHPLGALVGELRDVRRRFDVLASGDSAADVRAVFSWSYSLLSAEAARMFRLMGVHPGPDISVLAAASLTALPPEHACHVLAELASVNLISEHVPGRYAFHDLLRAYAAELAHGHDSDDSRQAGMHRVLDYYLHTAYVAAFLVNPARDSITLGQPQPQVWPENLAGREQALAWFQAERQVLLAAVGQAVGGGFGVHAWQLPWCLATFFHWQGHWQDLLGTQKCALAAARDLGDQLGQAQAHRHLGRAQIRLGAYADACAHLAEALNLGRQLGNGALQARVHLDLAWVFEVQDRHQDALRHAEQSLGLHRSGGYLPGEADALNAVGWCHARLGRYQEALDCCRQALAVQRELGDRAGEAAALDSLGYAHYQLREHAQAVACYQQAIDIDSDSDLRDQAEHLEHLGDAHQAAANPDSARRAWQQALVILDDLHDPAAAQVHEKLGTLDTDPRAAS